MMLLLPSLRKAWIMAAKSLPVLPSRSDRQRAAVADGRATAGAGGRCPGGGARGGSSDCLAALPVKPRGGRARSTMLLLPCRAS